MAASDYELWATQHGLIDVQQLQVLEFRHSTWGSLWITDYGVPFVGTTEAAVQFQAVPVAFTVELPKQTTTTQSELTLRMDALGGYVINNIRNMTDADRTEAVGVFWRAYLDNRPSVPALDTLQFVLVDVQATRLAVELRCAATMLSNVQSGTRYTIDRFPTLAYL